MTNNLIEHRPKKRRLAIALSIATCAAAFLCGGTVGSFGQTPPAPPKFGVYDPYGNFTSNKDVQIEHIFIPWEDVDLASLQAADNYARARGRDLLITVEPWSWAKEERISGRQLRRAIASGKHDGDMARICSAAGKLQSNPTIRWGHEMDNPNDHFPWSMWRPAEYIKAYRRVTDVCRKAAPNLKYMWSPSGRPSVRDYYPGDDYVDVVGLSVFGLQKADMDNFGRPLSFSETLAPAYARVAGFGKPIVIAELGYVGNAEYVANWDRDSRAAHAQFPALVATVYFNHEEVHPWLGKYGFPDWRVTRNVLK